MTSPRDNETTLRDELARLNAQAMTSTTSHSQPECPQGRHAPSPMAIPISLDRDGQATCIEYPDHSGHTNGVRIATIIDYLSRYPTACAELFLESLTPTEQEAVNPANFGVKAIHLAVSSLLSEQEMTMPELADGKT